MIVATRAALADFSVDLDFIPGWGVVEPLSDGDGEVGEVDILVLGASPSRVATYSPLGSILDCRSRVLALGTCLRRKSASSTRAICPRPNHE